MSSYKKDQNQREQNIEQETPVKTQSSIERQQESEEELTEEELEKIAGGFPLVGRAPLPSEM